MTSTLTSPAAGAGATTTETTCHRQVCLDMKGALVCFRSLGVTVKGPLEDPAVARWLAEPPIEDTASPQQQQQQKRALKKRKVPLPPPRAPPASLTLDRWVGVLRVGLGYCCTAEDGSIDVRRMLSKYHSLL